MEILKIAVPAATGLLGVVKLFEKLHSIGTSIVILFSAAVAVVTKLYAAAVPACVQMYPELTGCTI